MKREKITVNRTLVGVIALCCLAAAGAIWLLWADEPTPRLWLAGFLRVGLVMVAFWIALPSGNRPAAWANISKSTLIAALIFIVALVRAPVKVVLPLAIVLAVIGVILRPKGKYRPRQ